MTIYQSGNYGKMNSGFGAGAFVVKRLLPIPGLKNNPLNRSEMEEILCKGNA
jgi:hypothetical protein